MLWIEEVVAEFKVKSRHLLEGTEEDHENLIQSSRRLPRIQPGISRIQFRSFATGAVLLGSASSVNNPHAKQSRPLFPKYEFIFLTASYIPSSFHKRQNISFPAKQLSSLFHVVNYEPELLSL
jgi:hypothetical protein